MAEFILKDWYGKDQVFDKETIYVQGKDGELMPFTHGTGTSAELRYVTFMSYDGLIEYGKKAVAVGDDCADPIARGVFPTPTKESDVQYNYTFYGWATAPNGGADANALKAVTEDKTVYANFASTVRNYTITYYDSDGTTVLKTESLAYGSTPIYAAEKDGFVFDGWTPELTTVTGNMSYTAKWSENITFADGTWSDIVRIAESGEAQKCFTLGDTKQFSFTDPKGTSRTVMLKIVGFDIDTLSDGSGKAGITMVVTTAEFMIPMNTSTPYPGWGSCSARTQLQNMISSFPADLQNSLKTVTKKTRKYVDGTDNTGLETTNDKIWVPSLGDLGSSYNSTNYGVASEGSTGYTGMPAYNNADTYGDVVQDVMFTRSASYKTKNNVVTASTNTSRNIGTTACNGSAYGIIFGFCI